MLVAPSTAQDARAHGCCAPRCEGLADAPVRVLATYNRRLPPRPLPVPENARVVDWVSYSRTMPHCDVVVCHAGHGTLVRALVSGCAVVACPAVGDMNENAARLDWAGAGVRVPRRFLSPRVLRLAVERALAEPSIRERARELAAWASRHDPGRLPRGWWRTSRARASDGDRRSVRLQRGEPTPAGHAIHAHIAHSPLPAASSSAEVPMTPAASRRRGASSVLQPMKIGNITST